MRPRNVCGTEMRLTFANSANNMWAYIRTNSLVDFKKQFILEPIGYETDFNYYLLLLISGYFVRKVKDFCLRMVVMGKTELDQMQWQ